MLEAPGSRQDHHDDPDAGLELRIAEAQARLRFLAAQVGRPTLTKIDLKPLTDEEQRERERCLLYLHDFNRAFFPIIDQNRFVDGWHIGFLCELMHAVEMGQISRILVNLPQRHMKSVTISVMYAGPWVWARKPSEKFIVGTVDLDGLGKDLAYKARDIIRSEKYQRYFGDQVALRGDAEEWKLYRTTKGGARRTTSVNAKIIGEGGHRVIIDDAHDTKSAESDRVRTGTVKWVRGTMLGRFESYKTGAAIITGQRVHPFDVSAAVKEIDGWVCVSLPAENALSRRCKIFLPAALSVQRSERPKVGETLAVADLDSTRTVVEVGERVGRPIYRIEGSQWWWSESGERFSWEDPRTEHGEPLWPEHVGKVELKTIKADKGPRDYEAHMQQNPLPPEGAMFDRADWKVVEPSEIPDDCDWIRFWDLASTRPTAGKQPDWTAGAKVGRSRSTGEKYLADIRRVQDGPKGVMKLIRRTARADGFSVPIYIEQEPGSNSEYAIEYFDKELVGYEVHGKRATKSKTERARPVATQAGAGRWHVVSDKHLRVEKRWIDTFFAELEVFPEGANDDQVDCVTGASRYLDRGEEKAVSGWSADHHVISSGELINSLGLELRGNGPFVPPARWKLGISVRYDELGNTGGHVVALAVPPEGHVLEGDIFAIGELPLDPGLPPSEILRQVGGLELSLGAPPVRLDEEESRVAVRLLNPEAKRLQEAFAYRYGAAYGLTDRDPTLGLAPLRDVVRVDPTRPHPILAGVMGRPRFFAVVADAQREHYHNERGLMGLRRDLEQYYHGDEKGASVVVERHALRALLGLAAAWFVPAAPKSRDDEFDAMMPEGLRRRDLAEPDAPGYSRRMAYDLYRGGLGDYEAGETDFTFKRRPFDE